MTADFGADIIFSAETHIIFLYSGVNVVTNPVELSSIVETDDGLVIDLSDSSTLDGLVVGEVCFALI